MDLEAIKKLKVEKFKHVKPSEKYADQMMAFCDELRRDHNHLNGGMNIPYWLKEIEKEFSATPSGSTELEGVKLFVRTNDDKVVGLSCIREHVDRDTLRRMGGNISYVIRPSERRKGYNKVNLYMTLKECKRRGLTNITMTAKSDNRAASRSIRTMGGSFVRDYYDPIEPDSKIEEYNLNVNAALKQYSNILEFLIDVA